MVLVVNLSSVSRMRLELATSHLVRRAERARCLGLLGVSARTPALGFLTPVRHRPKKKRVGVIRSPFVYKKSGEAFVLARHRHRVVLYAPLPALGRLRHLLRFAPLSGVELTISSFELVSAPFNLSQSHS